MQWLLWLALASPVLAGIQSNEIKDGRAKPEVQPTVATSKLGHGDAGGEGRLVKRHDFSSFSIATSSAQSSKTTLQES